MHGAGHLVSSADPDDTESLSLSTIHSTVAD